MKRLLLLLAITLCWCGNEAFGQKREKNVESDGFVWYEIIQNGVSGAQNENGNIIIPIQFSWIYYYPSKGGWFLVRNGDNEGAYEKNGRLSIPTSRGYTSVVKMASKDGYWYNVKKNSMWGACDEFGKEIVPLQPKPIGYSNHEFYVEDENGKTKIGISLKSSSYASSSNSSSSSSISDYVFEFDSYLLGNKQINDKITVCISRSGNIKVSYGGSTFEFMCTSIVYKDWIVAPSISFCNQESEETLTMYEYGGLVYDSVFPITMSGNESVKKAFETIVKEVESKTFIPSAVFQKRIK